MKCSLEHRYAALGYGAASIFYAAMAGVLWMGVSGVIVPPTPTTPPPLEIAVAFEMASATPQKQPTEAPKAVPSKPLPPKKIVKVRNKTQPPKNIAPKASSTPQPPAMHQASTAHYQAKTSKSNGASGVTRSASYAHNPKPPYPIKARARKQQGTVMLRVRLSAKGSVEQITIHASSGHRLLDDAALRAVQQWSFTPAIRADQSVASSIIVPVTFRLR
jgi:periplasmic protein TonB